MAGKRFADVTSAFNPDEMWSGSKQEKKKGRGGQGEKLKASNKSNNVINSDNSFNQDNVETKKVRGRPKMDEALKKKHYNLLLAPATIEALNRAVGRIQMRTGKRTTVSGFITKLINDYLENEEV